MIEIAATHQLYFYQLFGETLGIGKQVPVAQVESVLADADVMPIDVGATDVSELLAALDAFVKVSTFRRGRVVVAIRRNDELDEALERATALPATKGAPKGKPWKAKASKVVMPTKPKPAPERAVGVEVGGKTTDVSGEGVDTSAQREAETPNPSDDVAATVPPDDVSRPAVDEAQGAAPAHGTGTELAEDTHAVTGGETTDTTAADEVDAPKEEATPTGMAERPCGIALNITYDPAAEATPAHSARHGERRTSRRSTGSHVPAQPSPTPALRLPRRFSQDVYCPNAMLLALCETLPPEADYLATLDAAWNVAATSEPDARRPIAFAVPAEGAPCATATIRRRSPTPSGRRWELVAVEPVAMTEPELDDKGSAMP